MKRILIAAAFATGLTASSAHESGGSHGGQSTDAGAMHVEVLTKAEQVQVFLADGAGKPVSAKGYKGLAILLVGGKVARIPLQPDNSDRLIGAAPAPVPMPVKGAIQITGPDGATVQASFK